MASCPRCGAVADPRILALAATLRAPVAAWAERTLPGWSPSRGLCPTCAAYFAHRARDHGESLHTTTEPPTTFPYYHPAEETVLSQAERLPDHAGHDGAGVTIAFLDSGYYPHPDLLVQTAWPDRPDFGRMDDASLAAAIAARPARLLHYVDLTDQGRRESLATPSLWDGAGDSWHGQMTTAIAAGNGLLSGGRWRGYAPAASLLPIKIGRGGGRIPEDDILAGLQWLLEDDRWQRYGVRVLNVSVGGDFDEPWQVNPVCLAAEELSRRGVLVVAAAGNRGRAQLLAPAQAPATLTVGGVDDANRRWSPLDPADVARLALYSHNYGTVEQGGEVVAKPEVLALGKWLPSPVLPPSPVFAEMAAIAHLRERLLADGAGLAELAEHWVRALHDDPAYRREHPAAGADAWRAEMWQALRKRMNAHKWIHAHYQHVDGTSVAAAQVAALAAQLFQANPRLSAAHVRAIILATALALPQLPPARTGAGLIQPARATATALHAPGGPLAGLPLSGTQPGRAPDTPISGGEVAVYFGLWAPDAHSVGLLGDFNGWAPDATPLVRTHGGWWHGRVLLPPGRHAYRFWVAHGADGAGEWRADPENSARSESGYVNDHAEVAVG